MEDCAAKWEAILGMTFFICMAVAIVAVVWAVTWAERKRGP